jgi:CHAD domain-containing protein
VVEPASILEKRLRRIVSLLPAVLDVGAPENVHDLRVATRRLQQTLDALYRKPRPKRVRSVRRVLRRSRKALGEWRNLDVVLEAVRRRQKRARGGSRRGWGVVADALRELREAEITTSRERLRSLAPEEMTASLGKLVASLPEPSAPGLAKAIRGAWDDWRERLEVAGASGAVGDLHAFRVATKRLRYRIEAASDLGETGFVTILRLLKKLQTAVGDWHDRQVLHAMTEAVMAEPPLSSDAAAVRALRRDLARDRARDEREVEAFLRTAERDVAPRLAERISA